MKIRLIDSLPASEFNIPIIIILSICSFIIFTGDLSIIIYRTKASVRQIGRAQLNYNVQNQFQVHWYKLENTSVSIAARLLRDRTPKCINILRRKSDNNSIGGTNQLIYRK